MVRVDAEGLRRRLYAPGASAADVERYRALGIVPRAAETVAPRPRRRFHPSALLVPVVVVAVLLGGVAVARFAARAATLAVVPLVPASTTLPLPAADRQAAREALASRDDVAVATFLAAHRAPPALATATRSLLVEQSGSGAATVDVDPDDAEAFSGRATVLLVLDRGGQVAWTTLRRALDPSGVRTLAVQQRRSGWQEAGALTTATYRYGSGEQPVELRVEAPPGTRWAVEVVFTD